MSALGGRLDRVVVGQLEHATYLARLELERSGGGARERRRAPERRHRTRVASATSRSSWSPPSSLQAAKPWARRRRPSASPPRTSRPISPRSSHPVRTARSVTDVDRTGPARKLHRADVITGVDGEAVGSARDLVAQLERRGDGHAMRVALQRDGRPIEVRLRVAPVSGADR